MNTKRNLSTPLGPLVFLGTFTTGYEVYALSLALQLRGMAVIATGLLLLITLLMFIYAVLKGQVADDSKFAATATAIIASMYIGAALFFSFTAR